MQFVAELVQCIAADRACCLVERILDYCVVRIIFTSGGLSSVYLTVRTIVAGIEKVVCYLGAEVF